MAEANIAENQVNEGIDLGNIIIYDDNSGCSPGLVRKGRGSLSAP